MTDKEIYDRLNGEIEAAHDRIMTIFTEVGINNATAAEISQLSEAIGNMIDSRKKVKTVPIPFSECNDTELQECEGVLDIQAKEAETGNEKAKKADAEILHFALTVLLSALVAFIVASLALR